MRLGEHSAWPNTPSTPKQHLRSTFSSLVSIDDITFMKEKRVSKIKFRSIYIRSQRKHVFSEIFKRKIYAFNRIYYQNIALLIIFKPNISCLHVSNERVFSVLSLLWIFLTKRKQQSRETRLNGFVRRFIFIAGSRSESLNWRQNQYHAVDSVASH